MQLVKMIRDYMRNRGMRIVASDITQGKEPVEIPAMSNCKSDLPPSDYHYVKDHVITDRRLYIQTHLTAMFTCHCLDDCHDGKCACSSNHSARRCYDDQGRLSSDYNFDAPEMIYECNPGCKCNSKKCKNSVIQKGTQARLILFKTKSRGWGIKALEPIKRGTFIGVYSGELITAEDSFKRSDDTYLFNLSSNHIHHNPSDQDQEKDSQGPTDESGESLGDHHQPNANQISSDHQAIESSKLEPRGQVQYVCDAKYYGNFTRFINHSCRPNLVGIRSFTTHQDTRFPYISFFANCDIPALAELTLNYGDNYWLVKGKRDSIYCRCKRSRCRFSESKFPSTLENHKKSLSKAA